MSDTRKQLEEVVKPCRDIFALKLRDYSPSWRIMRPKSVTDQIFIKAKRIRTFEETGVNLVGEDMASDFMAIVNYGVIGLIQLDLGFVDEPDITSEEALKLYDRYLQRSIDLLMSKNHDYGEAWRNMLISSYTDLILTKIQRTKEIQANAGKTLVSEGVDANYMDMINYALFALIKLRFGDD